MQQSLSLGNYILFTVEQSWRQWYHQHHSMDTVLMRTVQCSVLAQHRTADTTVMHANPV